MQAKNIKSFFGLGKNKTKNIVMSIENMDEAISKAVADNDRQNVIARSTSNEAI